MSFIVSSIIPALALVGAGIVGFLIYVAVRYAPIVGRIFEEKPLFLPLRVSPLVDVENVRFRTGDGLELAGCYLPAHTERRLGVIVFCHEYLSDRWSMLPYIDHLRSEGFDLFAFDFRNHGESQSDSHYRPLQWVTDHEIADLRAALRYLRSRPDHDPAGFGLMGISRGGGTALAVAGKDMSIWGVLTDGAFPTRGTMQAYIHRWAEIYVGSKTVWSRMPRRVFDFLGWVARKRSQKRLHCRFPDVERATSRIAPRPLFMIHGEKDAYIGVDIAKGLFAHAGEPRDLWIVPKAKHNRCRETQPDLYRKRVSEFFASAAPRTVAAAEGTAEPEARSFEASSLGAGGEAVSVVSGIASGDEVSV
ncbi:MAG: alpha/beta fold hydrolase [Isosphaeraceae bacterium]|nr:alpha/beta fold hydrolase [Isosphaeraceae bacterium]